MIEDAAFAHVLERGLVAVDGDAAPAPGEDLLGVAALAAAQIDGEGDGNLGLGDLRGIGDALGGERVKGPERRIAGSLALHDGEIGGPVSREAESEGGRGVLLGGLVRVVIISHRLWNVPRSARLR